MDDKKSFIVQLETFCKDAKACSRIDLHHLDYAEFRGNEYLYIFVGEYGFSEKRVNITSNTKQDTVIAFFDALQNWDDVPYLVHGNTFKDLMEEKNNAEFI